MSAEVRGKAVAWARRFPVYAAAFFVLTLMIPLNAHAGDFERCTAPEKQPNQYKPTYAERLLGYCEKALRKERDAERIAAVQSWRHYALGVGSWAKGLQYSSTKDPEQRRSFMRKAIDEFDIALDHEPLNQTARLKKLYILENEEERYVYRSTNDWLSARGRAPRLSIVSSSEAFEFTLENMLLAASGAFGRSEQEYDLQLIRLYKLLITFEESPPDADQWQRLIDGLTKLIDYPPSDRADLIPELFARRGEVYLLAGRNKLAQADLATAREVLENSKVTMTLTNVTGNNSYSIPFENAAPLAARIRLLAGIAAFRLGERDAAQTHFDWVDWNMKENYLELGQKFSWNSPALYLMESMVRDLIRQGHLPEKPNWEDYFLRDSVTERRERISAFFSALVDCLAAPACRL
ncbi:hypothetical protein ACFOOP_10945 [Marinicaulis aureus]|uniref:DUF4034 domain-containing protein n=1 Tax=Hyphococcus aureus TaxID=2666033 RepID=A0ABW1L3A5_9PROT